MFSMNGLLDWQLMFYSDEEVLARWADAVDRYPAYVDAVDRALANGEPVAVVGYTDDERRAGVLGHSDLHRRDRRARSRIPSRSSPWMTRNSGYAGANKELLEKLGFQFDCRRQR